MTEHVKKRRMRLEKLMDARLELNEKPMSNLQHYKALDYLFYEVEMLIREVGELKKGKKP